MSAPFIEFIEFIEFIGFIGLKHGQESGVRSLKDRF